MFKKTIAGAAIGVASLLAVAAPATAGDIGPTKTNTSQIGLLNLNNVLNNACVAPWNDGNVLAVEVPIFSPNQYQACNDGKTLQKQ